MLTGRRAPTRPVGRGERGFTLVELVVTTSLLMVVIGAFLSALEVGMTTEARASSRIDDEQAVRLVLAQLARDAHDARRVRPETALPDQLDLELPPPSVGAPPVHVEWAYETSGGLASLTRYVIDDSATPPTRAVGVAAHGLDNPVTVAPLALFGANPFLGGSPPVSTQDLSLLPGATAEDVARCAVVVSVSVVSNNHAPAPPFSETVSAELYNQAAERTGCP